MSISTGKTGHSRTTGSGPDAKMDHTKSDKAPRDKGSTTPGHEPSTNLGYWLLNQNNLDGIPEGSESDGKKHVTRKRKDHLNRNIPFHTEEYFHDYSSGIRSRSVLPLESKHSNILNVGTDIQSVADTGVWITNRKQFDDEMKVQQKYKTRIGELEAVIERMCDDYDVMYKETVTLYEKLNSSDKVPETYSRVLADRQILRDAEEAYKRRISAIQTKTRTIQDTNKKLELEIRQLKSKIPQLEDQFKKETQYNKLHWERKAMMSESETLKKQLKSLKSDLATNVRLGYWDMSDTTGREYVNERNKMAKGSDVRTDCDIQPSSAIIHELEGQLQHLSVIKRHQLAEIQNLRHNTDLAKKEQDAWTVEKKKYDLEIKHLKIRLAEAKKLHHSDNNKAKQIFSL